MGEGLLDVSVFCFRPRKRGPFNTIKSMDERLVPVYAYSDRIAELRVWKRINKEYPLFVRYSVAKKLASVNSKLPSGLRLQVDSGYRTRKTQQILWEYRSAQAKSGMASVPADLSFDPRRGVPPHCTGGAVDVSLVNSNGKEINLSEPFTKFYAEPQLRSSKVSARAQRLRLLLNKLMLEEDFAPNDREYWHFSYGDEAWAKFYGEKALYGELGLPRDFYYSFLKRVFIKVGTRVDRLFRKVFSVQTNY